MTTSRREVGRLLRRVVMLPAVVATHLVILCCAPVAIPVGALVSLVTRNSRPLRSTVLVACFSAVELVALLRVVELRTTERRDGTARDGEWQALVAWVVGVGYAAVRRILGVRVALEDESASVEEVRAADGVIVLARHCGPGDSLLIAWLLVVHYGLSVRIVLKNALRLDPLVDLAGDRLPFYFVRRRGPGTRDGVRRLAEQLTRGQALLLFPEGGNFSVERWRAAVHRLSAAGERLRARRARRNTHTLPPRVGGTLAALQSAPQAQVLLLAHSGLGYGGRDRPWWRVPVDQDMVVRTMLIDADEIQRDEASVVRWLDSAWDRVDTWVDGYAALESIGVEEQQ